MSTDPDEEEIRRHARIVRSEWGRAADREFLARIAFAAGVWSSWQVGTAAFSAVGLYGTMPGGVMMVAGAIAGGVACYRLAARYPLPVLGLTGVLILAFFMARGMQRPADVQRPHFIEEPGAIVTNETPIQPDSKLLATWNEKWYPVTVLHLIGDTHVRIHWDGWDATYDEDIARDKLRLMK